MDELLEICMSSLPQGWHSVPGPPKSASGSPGVPCSSVPVTIRKKWNSPLSNVPQTKLPSYKSSNLRTQNCNLNSTYRVNPTVPTCAVPQSKTPSAKPSPVKEYQIEITKLKKELSTVKAENSILKAKVRRVDDENLQKDRQLEKIKAEVKILQKNESSSIKKSRESQELLLLRQKCLRLESALKEKDLAIKKLTSEALKTDSLKTSSIQKQTCQVIPIRSNKSTKGKSGEKESNLAKSSQSRANVALKTEVTKLRDMIHKLEKENQDLQQQAKLHCEEIRRLKVQLKSKDRVIPTQSMLSKSSTREQAKNNKNSSIVNMSNTIAKPQCKTSTFNSSTAKTRLQKRTKSPFSTSIAYNSDILPNSQNAIEQMNDCKIGKLPKVPNGVVKQPIMNKQVKNEDKTKDIPSKVPVTKSGFVHAISTPVVQKAKFSSQKKQSSAFINTKEAPNDLEYKIKKMRENIAAKKIQRSWRQHQENLHFSSESQLRPREKELTFIISSLRHHKSRKDKINFLVQKKHFHPDYVDRNAFIGVIKKSRDKVWEQELNAS